ncbi:MAG: hypothetical protein N2560_00950 [Ignavibacteria bacterium]|nr:hypothetical protein [Ignavibacteria bacterium]
MSFFWVLKPLLIFFNKKFGEREKNWKIIFNKVTQGVSNPRLNKVIWIHSASMGEFEQAKPIIEEIKRRNPEHFIVATFFSPSGYENQKNYKFADSILYLPFDFFWNVKKFLDNIQPDIAIFIRYEYWLNYLYELKKRRVPTFLVSATQPYRNISWFYKLFLKRCLNYFTKIFVMDEKDITFFQKMRLDVPLSLEYDTRFDRVYFNIQNLNNPILHKEIFEGELIIVAGSIWEKDAELIISTKEMLKDRVNLKIIYVPHEPTGKIIDFIENNDKNIVRFSNLLHFEENKRMSLIKGSNILVDRIGYLLALYSIADIAYVGGGFGRGVHSVIEPAGYFIPIVCGGNVSNSIDAINLKNLGGLFLVQNEKEFVDTINYLFDKKNYTKVSNIVKNYFLPRIGSSKRIVDILYKYIN